MSEPFIGEVQIFGFNFAPRSWAFCNGAVLSIAQNTALFSLLGTTYGGNGQTTFALPNVSGFAACHAGQGPGLMPRVLGQTFGADTVTLTQSQMPLHNHGTVLVAQNDATKRAHSPSAGNALSVASDTTITSFVPGVGPTTTFAPNMAGINGGSQPHENRQPYLGMNFCIALQGLFPSRN